MGDRAIHGAIVGSGGDIAPRRRQWAYRAAPFAFSGTDARAVASFHCRVDDDAFQACTSPFSVKVKKGKHTFEVRAVDGAGNVDPSPATDTWKRKKKRK